MNRMSNGRLVKLVDDESIVDENDEFLLSDSISERIFDGIFS